MNRTQKQSALNHAASKIGFLSISVAFLCLPSASMAALISNLGGSGSSSATVFGGEPGLNEVRLAAGFTVGADQIGSFEFKIRVNNPNPYPVVLQLFSDSTGNPGSLLAGEFDGNLAAGTLPTAGLGDYTFTANGRLSAGTYWLVASTIPRTLESTATYDWSVTPVPDPSGVLLSQPILVGSQIPLSFSTMTGQTYYLQLNTNLVTTNWSNVQTNPGDGLKKTNWVNPVGAEGYYRLLRN
jgi:hypothetical protein